MYYRPETLKEKSQTGYLSLIAALDLCLLYFVANFHNNNLISENTSL